MKRLLLLFPLIFVIGLQINFSQGNSNNVFISSPANINPSSINTCQDIDTFRFRILNINVDTLRNPLVTYTLPIGVNYISASISSGFVITDSSVTNPQKAYLRIDTLNPGDNPTIEILVSSDCGVVGQITLANGIRVDAVGSSTYDTITTASYIPNNPSIITTSDMGIINAQFGGTYSRTFKLEQSGNGYLTEVFFERTIGSAYTLDSLNLNGFGEVPFVVIPGSGGIDTVRITIVDSMLVAAGITDSTFDQNDTITITEFITVVDCDGNNGGQAVGYWGCGGVVCEKVNPTSVGILFGAFAPDLVFSYEAGDDLGFYPPGEKYHSAYNCNMPSQRAVLVRNVGSEMATQISFEIYAIDPQHVVLDSSSFMWRKGLTGTPMAFDSIQALEIWNSSTEVSNIQFGGPVPRRYRVYLSSTDIEVGDSVYVQWAEWQFINDWDSVPGIGCTTAGGGYVIGRTRFWNMSYSDPCLKININEGFQGDQDYLYNRFVVGKGESPVNLFAGTPGTTEYTATSAVLDGFQSIGASEGALDSSAYMDFKFTLPAGLDYAGNPSDSLDPAFELIDADSPLKWYPSEVIDNDSVIIFRYYIAENPRPSGFSWTTNTKMNFSYEVDCSELPPCPAGNPTSTIKKEVYMVMDTNCGSRFFLGCVTETDPFTIFCNFCDPCPLGIRYDSLIIERSTYGLPDNNNDGYADTNSMGMLQPQDSLNIDTLVLDKYLTGDSITGRYWGHNNTGLDTSGNPVDSMLFCYGQLNVPFSEFGAGSGLVRIYDASTSTWHEGLTPKIFRIGNSAYLDASVDSLLAYTTMTPALPVGFSYQQDDSVYMEIKIGVNRVIGRTKSADLFSMSIWDSDSSFQAAIDSGRQFQCIPPGINRRRLTLFGFDDFKIGTQSWQNEGCNPRQSSDYYWIYMFETWLDQFPNEYRHLFDITDWEMEAPDGATLTNLRMDYYNQNPQSSSRRYIFPSMPFQYFAGGDSVRITNVFDSITQGQFGDIRSDGSVLMYIYPSWQLSCESPDNVTQSFGSTYKANWDTTQFGDIAITTLNPAGTTPYTQVYSSTSKRNYTYQSPELQTTVGLTVYDAIQKTATWTVNFANNAPNNADAFNTWFYVDNALSGGQITIDSIKDVATDSVYPPNGNGFYEFGDLNSLQTRQFNIFASYTNCNLEYIELYSGYNCPGYFTDINDIRLSGGGCEAEIDSLGIQPLEGLWQAANVVGLDSSDLCDPHTLEYRFTNVQVGHSYNTYVTVDAPLNSFIDTTNIMLYYPDSSTSPILVPSSAIQFNAPGEYLIYIDSIVPGLSENGLPGPLTSSRNDFRLSFDFELECGFVSGSQLKVDVRGQNACGSNTNVAGAPPQTVFVFGVPEPYFINPRITAGDTVKACRDDIRVRINALKLGSNAIGPNDSLRLTLPAGITYVSGSYNGLNNPFPNTVPTITSIGGVTIYEWNLPTPVAELDSIDFEIDVRVDSALSCGISNIQVQTISDASGTCISSGACDVKAQTGSRTFGLNINRPNLEFIQAQATSRYNSSTDEEVTVLISYFNSDTNRTTNYNINIYNDVNTNGIYDEGTDTLVYNTGIINRVITFNDTVNDTLTFIVSNDNACQYIFQFDSSSCMCAYDEIAVSPVISRNSGTDTSLCENTSIVIGGPTGVGLTYLWTGADAGTFSDSSLSNPTYNPLDVNSLIIDEVYLTTTRPSGCSTTDTLLITVYPAPNVSIIDDTTTCGIDSIILFSGGGDSYLWNTGSTDSNITVLPNTTTTYSVTISNTFGCSIDTGVTVTVLDAIRDVLVIDSIYPTCAYKGSITVLGSPTGTYEFSITSDSSGFQLSPTFTNLDTGTYTIWGRNTINPQCVAMSSPVVLLDTIPPLALDTSYFTPVSICGGATNRGSITAQVTGGLGTITYNLTGSFTASNTTGVFPNLLAGIYTVTATDSIGCSIDLVSDLWLPELNCDTLYRGIPSTGGTDSTCVANPGTGGPYTINTCDGSGTSSSGIALSFSNTCVTYATTVSPFQGDTACIIICDTIIDTTGNISVIVCDTTTLIYYPIPTPDTIVTVLPPGKPPVLVCADTSQHLGTSFTYSPCGGPTYGTMNRTLGNCYTYISFFDRIDTACVVICDEYGVCDTTIFIYVPPVTPDTVITTDTVVCVDTNDLLGAMVDSIVTCDGSGMSSNGGGVTIDPITGCVSTSPVFTGGITDTTCVVVCKTVAGVVICDTTIIVTVQPPTPDTIVQLTNGTTTDSCITASQLVGSTYTYTSCGAPSHGTMSNVDSCYRYVPTTNLLDTACTIICDEYGVCDTTIFIYVPPVTPDTVITTDTVVCVDTNDLLGAMVDSIVTCDGSGMSSNGGGVTIDPITGCVSTIPVFTGGITDTTCVVVCKTVAGVVICDTTIIVTVQPPTPDTIVQLTNGTTTDSCITTSQLVGSTYTYTSCGAPSHGTMSNVDSCYRYVPTTNLLDTACTIICDEYGVCDTTIFIYVPPVTPDTVITTDTVVCVDTNDLLGAMVDSIVTCDGSGMSSNGGGVTIDPITGCVSTIPVFTGGITDTTCVVVCKTVAGVVICDTTIIVTVQPPTPDTIVQLTNGTTTDSCITTSQLVGSTYTYTSCGAPSHGTMSNVDSCYRYVPTTNLLDTACTIICDEYGVCDTTIFIYVPPVTPDTVITTDTVVCVDTNDLLGAMVDSIVTCDGSGMSSNGGGVTIDPITGCVSTIPVFTGGITDTTCVVVCKTVAGVVICDTTIIVTVQPPTPDTIVQLTNGTPVDTCLSQSELLGSMYTYTSCGNPVHGVLTNNTDTCFNYSPITNTLDTACVVICDEYGVCDTTIFIYVPPVTPDTVITTDTVVCVDTNDLLGAMVDSIVTCDGSGMSSNGGGVTIDPITGCVSTIPVFTGGITDTTCVVVCKTVAGVVICDTTIIVTVQPPTPDTIVQLTNGTTTDSCITTSQLVGSTYTYTSCGAPSHGTMSNVDSCYRYVPTTNLLDTACTIICDEYGVCDTTIFIYVPPVTPDTVITTDTVVCVDTNDLLGAMVDSIVTCDGSGMSSNGGGVTIDPITGCVSTIPVFTGGITDTTCVVVCKTVAGVVICDTTIIVTVQPPTPDTIVQLTNGTTTDSCITTSQLVGSTYTYTSCGAPSHGTMSNVDSCYRYVPTTNLLDTACTIICDEYGVCDTTIFIYVPPVTPDTVITTDTVVCVDTNDLLGAMVDSIVTCDGSGMSSNGGGVTIDPITGCVSTSPVFTGGITDTTCVVVCKTVAGVVICDTTIIVTVQPPTPDTIIQLTNGMPVDTCLSQSELLGSMYTYTSCGNPVHGVLTNNTDTCFNYSPITNTLDTACVVICDEYGVCDTTIFIYVPPVTPDTIYSTDTVVCVDTTEMPAGFDTATGCDGMNPTMTRNGGTATIDAQGCVTISPVFVGLTDTTCIIICDTVFGLCDTTIIITKRPSVPDTIVDCIPRDGQANDSSMNTNDLLGPIVSTSVIQLPKHGQFTLTNDTSSSYQTSPFPILDTVTVAICDQYSCCDTFTFIYIPPMTVDTIKQQGGGTVCVDTTEMPAGRYTSIGTCDGLGMTSNGGPVTPLSGGCVSITPDFSVNPIDTTCIILCDTVLPMCECDTTYVISFRPTIPDTFAIQLPKGTNTADTCLTTSELFGTSYTYRRLGAPTPHGPVTTHNDTCINYVQTSTTKYLDTARVLICDECGNCDTTVIIYVPTPDPDTLLVGPVIPVTNVDTCVRLESTYMTGHYINTCDSTGTTSGGVPVTITGLCVRYPVPAPVFTGDTACIIVCDTIRNVTICDTTLIIYLPDTTPPTVVCKDDTVYLDNLGTVMIDTSNVLDTVYDNTLVHSVTVAPTMFNCSNVGVNLVTVTATDTNRNVDSCIARVTVLDTVPPTAICQNITIQLDSNGNASITAFDVDGGSTDNCAIASLVVNQTSFDCSHLGMNTVVLTVTDIHGNVSTCTATVTVEDNISPITYCPSDKQIVVRNTMCSYILPDYTGEASAWDNCLGNGVTITQTPAAGSEVFLENTDTTITLTATDGSGNISTCSFQLYARCVKELNIPQFFSPDGNGQNDTWEIPELANYPNNTVKVFNRWGNLVFEQKGYYTGWDGRSNVDRGVNRLIDNKVLPEGTYFYIIDLGEDGSIEPYVGYMQLKR